jgi:hypothetical protein
LKEWKNIGDVWRGWGMRQGMRYWHNWEGFEKRERVWDIDVIERGLERERGWDIDVIERSEREGFWQTRERKREGSDRLERKTEDEILTSFKKWKSEREAWGDVSRFKYVDIECK